MFQAIFQKRPALPTTDNTEPLAEDHRPTAGRGTTTIKTVPVDRPSNCGRVLSSVCSDPRPISPLRRRLPAGPQAVFRVRPASPDHGGNTPGARKAAPGDDAIARADLRQDRTGTLGQTRPRPGSVPPATVPVARYRPGSGDWRPSRGARVGDLGKPLWGPAEGRGGSLAFVYRATYEDEDEEVAIKVRRPGIVPLIATDLRVIDWLLPTFVRFVPEQYEYSLRNIADDFERVIFEEFDFERERRIMTEIHEDFSDDDRVRIPEAYTDVSTERVLTMEYLDGVKITDVEELQARGYDPAEYAHRILTVYLEMGLVHGVYQADPHPGNLAVNEDGQLVIDDFGMSDRLDTEMQRTIIDLYRSVANHDIDMLMDALVDLNVLDPNADRTEVSRVLSLVIEELEGREGLTWRNIVAELGEMLYELPFRIPPSVRS